MLGPVLSLAVAPDGDYCFSGGIDATIRCWNMPHSTVDPYDSYGKIYLMLESKNDIGVPIIGRVSIFDISAKI